MAAELVEGPDLFVGDDDCVYMKTIAGAERVDVIYRRIDDLFIDPEAFREDSILGVPGLMRAWRAGKVALANAPGCGIADDKVIYSYVPDMIRYYRYYLAEEPLLANVPSYRCVEKEHRDFVLDNLDKLVVKPANESGGYGLLMGPMATRAERDAFARSIRANPRNFMAQPMISLYHRADAERWSRRGAASGPATVHPLRRRHPRHHRRPHPRGDEEGFDGGQLVPGRRQQGHLGGGG